MKTINSKELRNSLDKTFDAVIAGEDVVITHRFKQPVRITKIMPEFNKQKLDGLAKFDSATKKPSPYDKNVTLKELYSRSASKKYGK